MKFLRHKILLLILVSFVWMLEHQGTKNNFYNKFDKSKINLSNSNINSTSLEIEVNEYELQELIIKSKIQYKVTIDGGTPILNKGFPDLPKLSASIIIPDNATMKVQVLNTNNYDVSNIDIAPSKGNLNRSTNPAIIPYEYDDIYNQNKF